MENKKASVKKNIFIFLLGLILLVFIFNFNDYLSEDSEPKDMLNYSESILDENTFADLIIFGVILFVSAIILFLISSKESY
jgi:uncharacterized membrane protein